MSKKQDDMPEYGTSDWRWHQYKKGQEARKGSNFEYWSEGKHRMLLTDGGYKLHAFVGHRHDDYTYSELIAKEVVEEYRNTDHYARILCGMSQNVQRMKTFSVIYKKRKNNV
jgi:hypothetical protein